MKEERIKLMPNNLIYQVVVYKNPKDFPGMYVARRWNIVREGPERTDEHFVAKTIGEIRSWIEKNYPELIHMQRDPDDDPVIYEVWI